MENYCRGEADSIVVEEILSLLQEKRTVLKAIRIGLAIIVAQTSLLGFLMAVPAYRAFIRVGYGMILFAALNLILASFAVYFLVVPLLHMYRLNRKILRFKRMHHRLGCKIGP
jgi:uncharacterized membrane protein